MIILPQYFLVLFICSWTSAQVGDECTFEITGISGICKKSPDCPSAEEQAKNGISPTICGFYQLTVPIVCCEKDNFGFGVNDNTFFNREQEPTDSIVYPSDSNEGPSQSFSQFSSTSEEKCQEYNKVNTGVIQAIPLVTNTEAININIVKCDYNGVALIVGGKPALAGEFPFMAAVGFNVNNGIEWRCGGTLISEEYIVTAAHCTYSRDAGSPEIVRLGDLDLSTSNDGSLHQDFNIRRIVVHPKYKYPLKYNDIALIQLSRKINKFTKFIRPACLYNKAKINQSQAIATGWGKTDYAAAETSNKLMKVFLNVYNNNECSRVYQTKRDLPEGIKSSSMLCAGELRGERDTCQGDSGGPLLITKQGNQCQFYVIGVTSFGKACGQAYTPAVYTRISHFVSWIEKTIW